MEHLRRCAHCNRSSPRRRDPMAGEPRDEEARLIGRLLNEDPAVQMELFRKYDGVMRRRANRVLRDAEAVEDAVQDAWLTVLTRIGDFSGRSAILTWIVA